MMSVMEMHASLVQCFQKECNAMFKGWEVRAGLL